MSQTVLANNLPSVYPHFPLVFQTHIHMESLEYCFMKHLKHFAYVVPWHLWLQEHVVWLHSVYRRIQGVFAGGRLCSCRDMYWDGAEGCRGACVNFEGWLFVSSQVVSESRSSVGVPNQMNSPPSLHTWVLDRNLPDLLQCESRHGVMWCSQCGIAVWHCHGNLWEER